jgi:5-methylcytosine-specific restriction protein A
MTPRRRAGTATPFVESKAWRKLRLVALRRDHYRCTACGADVRGSGQARIDHVLPRSSHPHLALTLSNVRTLCPSCDNQSHREKGLPLRLRTGERIERIAIRGADRSGVPLDPKHHWNAK